MVVKRTQIITNTTVSNFLVAKKFDELSQKEKDTLLRFLFEKFGLIKHTDEK